MFGLPQEQLDEIGRFAEIVLLALPAIAVVLVFVVMVIRDLRLKKPETPTYSLDELNRLLSDNTTELQKSVRISYQDLVFDFKIPLLLENRKLLLDAANQIHKLDCKAHAIFKEDADLVTIEYFDYDNEFKEIGLEYVHQNVNQSWWVVFRRQDNQWEYSEIA